MGIWVSYQPLTLYPLYLEKGVLSQKERQTDDPLVNEHRGRAWSSLR